MQKVNETQFKLVNEWFKLNEQLSELKAQEAELRKQVMEQCFPQPKEGSSNKLDLGDGYIVQMTHKVNRSLDEEAFLASRDQLAKDGFKVDELTKTKISLNESAFKKLNDDSKHIFAEFVTEKPSTGSLKVSKPKRGVK